LLNPISSALTLSGLDKEDTTDLSADTDKKEPTIDLNNANEEKGKTTKDSPSNDPQDGLSSDVKNNYIVNSKQNSILINELYSSNDNFNPDILQVGDILFWDVNRTSNSSNRWIRLTPKELNGHCGIYIGINNSTGEHQFIEAVPKGVRISNISADENSTDDCQYFAVGRVTNANYSQKCAAVNWTRERVGSSYQEYWKLWLGGPIKSFNHYGPRPTDSKWYCSELVWAAYYNISNNTATKQIDIDKNGWAVSLPFPFNVPWVSPLEILEDDNVTKFYEWPGRENGTKTLSLSVDSISISNSNALIYLNYGSNSNILTNPSSSLNTNALISKLLNLY
jgi:uncharacterized protein YycO